VDRNDHCWVIDFGLTCLLAGQDSEGRIVPDAVLSADPVTTTGILGTPSYMAPEQWPKKKDTDRVDAPPLDARTDVYGLGVTLYELLTLRPAFEGETHEAIRAKVFEAKPVPIEERTPKVPPDLAAICRKAMQKESKDRYTMAQEFADDLRRWINGEPTRARPAWVGRRLWMWARRNRGWAAAIILGVLLLTTATVLATGTVVVQKRELNIQEMQSLQMDPRRDGWADEIWGLGRVAGKSYKDARLRDHMAASLFGLDAKHCRDFERIGASSVAFDRDGKRLVMGAWTRWARRPPNRGGSGRAR